MEDAPEDSSMGWPAEAGCCNAWGFAEQPGGNETEESMSDPLVEGCEVG